MFINFIYILSLLLHNSLKSFDGGETFTGSIMEEFSVDNNKQYQGNLRAIINNASIGDESNQAIIDEIRSCLKPGIDDGIFSLTSQDNIILKFKESHCYITINIIINKKRESLIFYYDKGINTIKLTSKR